MKPSELEKRLGEEIYSGLLPIDMDMNTDIDTDIDTDM